jgi:hypothetical protein
VAAITEKHAGEMVALLTDVAYLERCPTLGIAPETGRRSRSDERQARLMARLATAIAESRGKYESCVDLYDEAFGDEAARQLDEWVRAACRASSLAEAPLAQCHLFD